MEVALEKLKGSGNRPEAIEECILTLHKIAENAAQKWNPTSGVKYRTIKQSSATITNKVTSLPGGVDCLLALGFVDAVEDGDPVWRVAPDKICVEKLWDGLAALRVAKDSMASIGVDHEKSQAANQAGGIEGTIRDMLTSPAKLNQILQSPMIRQMISSSPDVVEGFLKSTPEARETLTIYPEMRSQLETLMGRPLRLEEGSVATLAASTPTSAQTVPISASTVQANVYDITQGMAKAMSMMLVGKQIDLVPHTGIVVFGREYFFGGGPAVSENPGQAVPVPVAQTIVLGETSKTPEELESHISNVLAHEHNEQNYNLLTHNCNHYANDVSKFLLNGKGLPDYIVDFGQDALSTPQGQQLRGMIENIERNMRQSGASGGLDPFGTNAPDTTSMSPFGHHSGASPPAMVPSAGGSHSEIVARLMEMGFPPTKCQESAAASEGDFDLALALLMSEND